MFALEPLIAQEIRRSLLMENAVPSISLHGDDFSVKGKVLVSTGQVAPSDNYMSTDFIPISSNALVECTVPFSAGAGVVYFDKDKALLSGYCTVNGGEYSGKAPDGASYVRFSRRTDSSYDPDVRIFDATDVSLRTYIQDMWEGLKPVNNMVIQLVPDYRPVFSKYDFDGKSAFRIPVHIRTKHGTIIVVSEIKKAEHLSTYGVVIARSMDNGRSFSKEITSGSYPCLLYDKINDAIYLFEGLSYCKSVDDGKTWSAFKKAVASPQGWNVVHVSSNNGIQLTNGVLAVPCIFQKGTAGGITQNRSAVLYSSDYGNSWQFSELTPSDIISNEFCIAEYAPNQIMINARGGTELEWSENNPGRRVFVAVKKSHDNRGKWTVDGWKTDESDCTIKEPVCNAAFISCSYQRHAFGLFCNPQSRDGERKNLLLQVSSDFSHWTKFGLLTPFDRAVYGYCSLDYSDGVLSFVYEDIENGILYADLSEYMDEILQKVVINNMIYNKK